MQKNPKNTHVKYINVIWRFNEIKESTKNTINFLVSSEVKTAWVN